ncbi:DUF2259 domain-containing protein [Aminobacter sp. HY435]|uniref:DUF2259 domain-containing protein n=1 Tax=Aminobacter sp. HY435 TaxID=2970917 RepID=UPI0022B9A5B9|nr:DUF2259 domain-containing protein [Aminobacter sp. HY435]
MKSIKLLCLAGVSLLAAQTAQAGDAAELNVLGFGADGKTFAFEEFGVQDGSGFPYANRFYIDTTTDEFLPDTPIRVMLEDEGKSAQAARDEARLRGEKIARDADLAASRGHLAGFNAVTENSADPHKMVVNPRPVFPPIDPQLEFNLEEIDLGEIERCPGIGPVKGFRLTRTVDGKSEVLQEDKDVPQSRACPTGYRIGGVQTFFAPDGKMSYAVLVTVIRHGFEGPDHRWIAVTGRS